MWVLKVEGQREFGVFHQGVGLAGLTDTRTINLSSVKCRGTIQWRAGSKARGFGDGA